MHTRSLQQWFLLFVLLLSATLTAALLDSYVSFTSQAMIFVIVVAIAAYRLDRLKSISGALTSILLLNFFFVPPRWTFHIEQSEHLIALATMLIVALVINHLSTHLKNETANARLNEQRARQLQHLAIDLASVDMESEIKALGQQAFDSAFKAKNFVVKLNLDKSLALEQGLSDQQINGLYCCVKEVAWLGAGSRRWAELHDWYLPIGKPGLIYGAVCVTQAPHDDDASLAHAHGLCALLAQAYSRLQMNLSMQAAHRSAEQQQLQSLFLSAISHDLRTPLAVMVATASALQSQGDKLSSEEQNQLLKNIIEEANYLTTVTDNTLQLVRLKNAESSMRRDWESMEEIVGAVLSRIRQRDIHKRIKAEVAPQLPLLKIDPVLIAQLLSNLLDNAMKYSDGTIELNVSLQTDSDTHYVKLAIKDRGPGIPEEEQESIFLAYSRLGRHDQSNQRSAGLGLAVCRAIAVAHQAQLTVRKRRSGGSCFLLCLPLSAEAPLSVPESSTWD